MTLKIFKFNDLNEQTELFHYDSMYQYRWCTLIATIIYWFLLLLEQ